jgi:DUF971 family protein
VANAVGQVVANRWSGKVRSDRQQSAQGDVRELLARPRPQRMVSKQEQPKVLPVSPAAFTMIDGNRALVLYWPDGARSRIDAQMLWLECPSALQRRRRLDATMPQAPHDLALTRVTAIGRYGVNIAFSDGHDRGVFPWSLLRALAGRPGVEDFIISSATADVASV